MVFNSKLCFRPSNPLAAPARPEPDAAGAPGRAAQAKRHGPRRQRWEGRRHGAGGGGGGAVADAVSCVGSAGVVYTCLTERPSQY